MFRLEDGFCFNPASSVGDGTDSVVEASVLSNQWQLGQILVDFGGREGAFLPKSLQDPLPKIRFLIRKVQKHFAQKPQ